MLGKRSSLGRRFPVQARQRLLRVRSNATFSFAPVVSVPTIASSTTETVTTGKTTQQGQFRRVARRWVSQAGKSSWMVGSLVSRQGTSRAILIFRRLRFGRPESALRSLALWFRFVLRFLHLRDAVPVARVHIAAITFPGDAIACEMVSRLGMTTTFPTGACLHLSCVSSRSKPILSFRHLGDGVPSGHDNDIVDESLWCYP